MNSLKLGPALENLYRLNDFIHEICPDDMQVDLIVEEIFVNIVSYSGAEYVIVNADYTDERLTIEFVDNGVEFNPLLKDNPSFPDNVEESKIGGLGIYLSKQLSDVMYYKHVGCENHLTIIKSVEDI